MTAMMRSNWFMVEVPGKIGFSSISSPRKHPTDHISTPLAYLVEPRRISGGTVPAGVNVILLVPLLGLFKKASNIFLMATTCLVRRTVNGTEGQSDNLGLGFLGICYLQRGGCWHSFSGRVSVVVKVQWRVPFV